MKHLITSGCSYTAHLHCWPFLLKDKYGFRLYNMANPSVGNDWVLKSSIYAIQTLFNNKIDPDDITVSVMWTHPARKSFFISKNETPEWELLLDDLEIDGVPLHNPINFIDADFSKESCIQKSLESNSSWLIGDTRGKTYPDKKLYLDDFRSTYIMKYYTEEGALIELLENIVFLQSFCKSKNIKLINQYYGDFFSYPEFSVDYIKTTTSHITKKFINTKHLYDMIDFSTWTSIGLVEYSKKFNLDFMDTSHPGPSAHIDYTNKILIPKVDEIFK